MGADIKENASLVGTLTAGSGTQVVERVERDYNKLENKPTLNGIELSGDVTSAIGSGIGTPLSNLEIETLIQSLRI